MSEFTAEDRAEMEQLTRELGFAMVSEPPYDSKRLYALHRLLAERDRLVEELTYAKQRRDEVEDALIVQTEQCARLRGFANAIVECANRSAVTAGRHASPRRAVRGGEVVSRKTAYSTWRSMISRCTDPRYAHFEMYGGRGIRVCEQLALSTMAVPKAEFWSVLQPKSPACAPRGSGYASPLRITVARQSWL